MFRALSNPNRLKIFLRLVKCCGNSRRTAPHEEVCSCVGELGRDLGIAASTLSHHVKALRQAGLINMERNGQQTECWIESSTLTALSAFFRK